LAQNAAASVTGNLLADIAKTPAVQSLARRLESGSPWSYASVATAAQPFFVALLQQLFPSRPIVVVTENLKAQELAIAYQQLHSFAKDLTASFDAERQKSKQLEQAYYDSLLRLTHVTN